MSDIEKTIYRCVMNAILEVGVENFQKTSMFVSSHKRSQNQEEK